MAFMWTNVGQAWESVSLKYLCIVISARKQWFLLVADYLEFGPSVETTRVWSIKKG